MLTGEAPRNSRACPYCGSIFPKPTKRKTRCEDCRGDVYVRTKQLLFNSDLLTEQDMMVADFFKTLAEYGATEDDYFKASQDMRARFGAAASSYDAVWALSNRLIAEKARTSTSPGDAISSAKLITLSQAWYQYRRGHNPAPYLNRVRNYELQEIRNTARLFPEGILVKVSVNGCCDTCGSLFGGKTYDLKDLFENPVLPVPGCTKNLEKRNYSYCTCIYTWVENH